MRKARINALAISPELPTATLGELETLFERLSRHGTTCQRLSEESCSYEWADTDSHRKREEAAELKFAAAEKDWNAKYGKWLTCERQTDPRGQPYHFKRPNGRTVYAEEYR